VVIGAFADWLGSFAEASEGVASYLGGVGARSTIIRAGLEAGESATSILNGMRSIGLGMRTQNYYQLVHQIREGASAEAGWTWGGPGTTITPGDVNQLAGGSAGKYMVNVRSYYTSVDENGDLENGYTTTSVLQDDLDLDQAVADAQQIQGNKYTGEGGGTGQITGWDISSVNQWQGK